MKTMIGIVHFDKELFMNYHQKNDVLFLIKLLMKLMSSGINQSKLYNLSSKINNGSTNSIMENVKR